MQFFGTLRQLGNCTAGVGVQEGEKFVSDDKSLPRGQGPNLVGLDAPFYAQSTLFHLLSDP